MFSYLSYLGIPIAEKDDLIATYIFISAVGLFPAMWRFFLYWISPGLHLLNTNTERWHQLQYKLLGMTCWKRNQNVSRHLAACQLPQLEQCGSPGVEVQCFPWFTRIKLSNTADWYMWNITDILPDESCVDMTYPDNMLAGLEGITVTMCCQTVRVFCIQSQRIDHKHGKILSDCQTRETLA